MSVLHPVLVVPGLGDSPRGHWQTWLEDRLPNARRVYQHDWRTPNLKVWAGRIRRSIEDCEEPPIVVAHSFGVLATVQAVSTVTKDVRGLLLVAPADPAKFGQSTVLASSPIRFPTTLVVSQTDPWMQTSIACSWGAVWGAQVVNVGPAGHINVASGHGEWPMALDLIRRLDRVAPPPLRLVRA